MARGSSVSLIVGVPAGVTAKTRSAAFVRPRQIVALPSPWIVQRRSAGAPSGVGAFVCGRRDRTLDARLDHAGLASHDEDGILEHGQRLRVGRLDVDDHRRPAGVRRRVDPGVDAASGRRQSRLAAAPVEGGGEPAVELRPRRRPPPRRPSSRRRSGARRGRARPCAGRAWRPGSPRPRARVAPDARPTAPASPGRRRWRGCRPARSPDDGLLPASRSSRAMTSRAAGQRSRMSGASAASEADARTGRRRRCAARAERTARRRATRRRGRESRPRAAQTSGGQARSTRSARPAGLRERRQATAARRLRAFGMLRFVVLRHARSRPPSGKTPTLTSTKAEVCRGRSIRRTSAAAG